MRVNKARISDSSTHPIACNNRATSNYLVTSSNQRESVISVSSHGRTSIVSSSSCGGRPRPAVATSALPPMHNPNESISSIEVRDIDIGAGQACISKIPSGANQGHGLLLSTLPDWAGVPSSPSSKRPPASALVSFLYPARDRERGSAVHASTPSTGSTILPYAAPYSPKHGHMRPFSGSGTHKTSTPSLSSNILSPSLSSTSSLSSSRTSGTSFDATSSTRPFHHYHYQVPPPLLFHSLRGAHQVKRAEGGIRGAESE